MTSPDQPTPSQAEGERDDEPDTSGRPSPPRPTPSQAEGERDDDRDVEEPGSL
ncbi:hypothetical protein [Streptomyces griseoviridis]|jgi:hypothetical protein|uniref:Uncharacterized protein n=1 Tax=Streptomyces griseoviridis TaxID=45398 RepID=A0ABT9LD11_STRGD|nr:hypothetical protein [Streptomyces griseoviridis]MDP9681616.1 hypothetical protein [Streptomyces griseoviridis]GGS73261.1 hypothetical protein GCM10010240_02760 [Streptomyces griseoviridis]